MKKLTILFLISLISISGYCQYNFEQPDFFRKYREKPLLYIPIAKELLLTDFGAIADDNKDDLDALIQALNKAKQLSNQGNGVRIVFPKGQIDLFSNKVISHIVKINNLKNVEIDGNGAKLIIRNPEVGIFSIFKSENIIIKNLFIDYDPLPFTQGRVTKIDFQKKTFTLKIDKGFPSLEAAYFKRAKESWGMLKDKDIPGKMKEGVRSLYPSKNWKKTGENIFEITMPNKIILKDFEVGDCFVQLARNNGRTIFKANSSKNITFLNNVSYASPAGSYNASAMYEWSIIGSKILMKNGRIQSANADCIHVTGSYIGPWVQDCLFEGYSDDAVNLKTTRRFILEKVNAKELIVKYNVQKGEIIRIYNPRDGILIAKTQVTRAKYLGDNKMLITLKDEIDSNIQVGENKINDLLYIDTRSSESFVFKNNTFRNARRYGMLLQSSFGLIERNVFENLSQSAISIYNGVDWGEGFAGHNIMIKTNLIKNCGFDKKFNEDPAAATIKLRVNKLKDITRKTKWKGVETASWQGLESISIINNIISYNKLALSVESTKNAIITGNKIVQNSRDNSKNAKVIFKENNSNLIYKN